MTELDKWLEENDPTNLGGRIAKLEREFKLLSEHPDPYISSQARHYLKQVDAMKQVIMDGLQTAVDSQNNKYNN